MVSIKKRFTYYSFKDYLINKFGYPLYRVPIDLALSCPHRNNKLEGCIFCSEDGARARHLSQNLDISTQILKGIDYVEKRYHAKGNYIAYFQSYTNTNAEISILEELYNKALQTADFKMIFISTRPDCLGKDVISFINSLNQKHETWVELGVQSSNDNTLQKINRGHNFSSVVESVHKLNENNIKTVAHIILGLPDETHEDYCKTINDINKLPFSAVKIHNMLLLKNSPLADAYNKYNLSVQTGIIDIPAIGKINLMNEYEYAGKLIDIIRRIPKDRPLLRINADAPEKNIIGPRWKLTKGQFLEIVENTMIENNYSQGDLFDSDKTISNTINAPLNNLKVRTADNSYTFYSPTYKENFHSIAGAESESWEKFIKPSELEEKLKCKKEVNILDIGFGLGYNALSALDVSDNVGGKLNIISLEKDINTLSLAETLYSKRSTKHIILKSLSEIGKWNDHNNKIELIIGDARYTCKQYQEYHFDIIFLDAFSPQRNPELWALDFFRCLYDILDNNGVLVTYSAAFPVRGAMLKCGFYVGTTEPFGRKKGGTIAYKNKMHLKTPLDQKELDIITKSTVGIPYRDPGLNNSAKHIFEYKTKLTSKMRAKGYPKWYKN